MGSQDYSSLNEEQRKLLDAAEEVMALAYNPYSNFFVGAALLAKDGAMISGANVENASFGMTICAERSAIVRANAMGKRMFTAFAVIAKGEKFETKEPTAPCGACRQVLYEMRQVSEVNLVAVLSNTKKDKILITSIDDLLPMAFGPADLGIDAKKYQR